jgi:hypothetical protein
LLILGDAQAGLVNRSDLMISVGLARIVTLTRNGTGLYDLECQDLGNVFGPCRPMGTTGPFVHRWGHAATRLLDGTVLVTGGMTDVAGSTTMRPIWQAEIFNPTPSDQRVPVYDGATPCPTAADGPIGLEPIQNLPPDAGPGDADTSPSDTGPDDTGPGDTDPVDTGPGDTDPGDADLPPSDAEMSGDGAIPGDAG